METLWRRNQSYGGGLEPEEVEVIKRTPKTITIREVSMGLPNHQHRLYLSDRVPTLAEQYGAVANDRYRGPLFEKRSQVIDYQIAALEEAIEHQREVLRATRAKLSNYRALPR